LFSFCSGWRGAAVVAPGGGAQGEPSPAGHGVDKNVLSRAEINWCSSTSRIGKERRKMPNNGGAPAWWGTLADRVAFRLKRAGAPSAISRSDSRRGRMDVQHARPQFATQAPFEAGETEIILPAEAECTSSKLQSVLPT